MPWLAVIHLVQDLGAPVDPGYGVPLPPVYPAHPIARPPVSVMPPIYYPPVYPAHPIARPPVDPGYGVPMPPLGMWGGAAPPHVDNTLPGAPPGIWGGGNVPMPTPPIYIPPGEQLPPEGNGDLPTHPIYIPPVTEGGGDHYLVYVIVPGKGGCWFLIEVPPVPTVPEPKKK